VTMVRPRLDPSRLQIASRMLATCQPPWRAADPALRPDPGGPPQAPSGAPGPRGEGGTTLPSSGRPRPRTSIAGAGTPVVR
jgi:hypothetical protein